MDVQTHPTHGIASEKERLLAVCQSVRKQTPYFKQLPFEVQDLDKGWVRLRFHVAPQFCNRRGIAAGGVLAAFCDTLMGMASRTLGYRVTTLEINMNYVRQVQAEEDIVGVGQVVHHGGKTIVVECEFFDKEGKVIVKGRSSFYIIGKLD